MIKQESRAYFKALGAHVSTLVRRGRPYLPSDGRSSIERRALPHPDQEGFPGESDAMWPTTPAVGEASTSAKFGALNRQLPVSQISVELSRRRVRTLTMIVCRLLDGGAFSAAVIP